MPTPSPDWFLSSEGELANKVHLFGNGSDRATCTSSENDENAMTMMRLARMKGKRKRGKKTRARTEANFRDREREEEEEEDDDDDDDDDDDEMGGDEEEEEEEDIAGEYGEFKLEENYENHVLDGTNYEREMRRLRKFARE
jgi:hypothetical protein